MGTEKETIGLVSTASERFDSTSAAFELPQDAPHEQSSTSKPSFYKSGGTLSPDEPSYVERDADRQLHAQLSEGQFCYVLTSRQMGKSSLMNHISARFRRENVIVADLDLTTIGQNLTVEQWYDGLVYQIGRCVNLKAELRAYWQANAHLGPLQRFIDTLRGCLLNAFTEPVVLFVDEIEVVRSLPFSTDEFFAAIRECYNRRASDPEMRRLTFCLLGMATPQDLIKDPRITPFNIGRRIDLTDFTMEEARPLGAGMCAAERDGDRLLRRVLYWTNGQPYLTQRLCQAVAEDHSVVNEAGVDRLCHKLFLSPEARESEPNLVPLREYVLRSAPDTAAVLDVYQNVLAGRKVANDPSNINITILQLAGVTRARSGRLEVRNRIYRNVFNRAWIRANMPDAELRRQRAAFVRAFLLNASVFGSVALVAISSAVIAVKQYKTAKREQRRTSNMLYVADMGLADQALKEHNVDEGRALLKAHVGDEMTGFEYGYLWNMCDSAYYTCRGSGGYMTGVAFSPDSAYFACCSIDGSVEIVDVARRAVVRHLSSVPTPFANVEYSRTGDILAVVGGNSVTIWDTRTWKVKHVLTPVSNNEFVTDVSIDSRGQRIVASTSTGEIVIYNASNWKTQTKLSTPGRWCYSIAFSPSSELLAGAGADGIVRVWDGATGKPIAALPGHSAAVRALAFSDDGRRLAASGEDNRITIWNTDTWQPKRSISTDNETVYGLAWMPGMGELAAGGSHTSVELWKTDSLSIDRILNGHSQAIHALAVSPDGKWIATASWDQTAKLWSVRSQTARKLAGSPTTPSLYSLSRDGYSIAGVVSPHSIGIWNEITGEREDTIEIGGRASAISNAADGQVVAIADGRSIKVIEWPSHRVLWASSMQGPGPAIISIALSPDGKSVAAGDAFGHIEVVGSRGRIRVPQSGDRSGMPITSLAFSSDSRWLAASSGGSVYIFSTHTYSQPRVLLGHHANVTGLAFSDDDLELSSASVDGTVKLWNMMTLREVLTLSTGETHPDSLAFAPTRTRLELVNNAGGIYEWTAASAAEIAAALK